MNKSSNDIDTKKQRKSDYNKIYYLKNIDLIRSRYNKEYHCIKQREYFQRKGKYSLKRRFSEYKHGATKRGFTFDLSFDLFSILCTSPCFYCAVIPNPIIGVDRKDNDIGYTIYNSVPCCKKCNYMKRKLSVSDFISNCISISKHHKNNQAEKLLI